MVVNTEAIQSNGIDVVVPDLHDAAGIFAPEVARRGLVAQFGPPRPETAPETARRLAREGVSRVRVHGASNDSRACRVLSGALEQEGMHAEIRLHGAKPRIVEPKAGELVASVPDSPVDNAELRGLHVLPIEEAMRAGSRAWSELARDCERALQRQGAEAVRLQTPPLRQSADESGLRASPLAESLRLDESPWREFLLDLIATGWPLRRAAWVSLLQDDALAINPIENVYAGQHLRDRNRDLMVNIL